MYVMNSSSDEHSKETPNFPQGNLLVKLCNSGIPGCSMTLTLQLTFCDTFLSVSTMFLNKFDPSLCGINIVEVVSGALAVCPDSPFCLSTFSYLFSFSNPSGKGHPNPRPCATPSCQQV